MVVASCSGAVFLPVVANEIMKIPRILQVYINALIVSVSIVTANTGNRYAIREIRALFYGVQLSGNNHHSTSLPD